MSITNPLAENNQIPQNKIALKVPTNQINSEEESSTSNSSNYLKKTSKLSFFPRSVRWIIFSIFVFLNIIMNIDHGTVPAATTHIKNDLKINEKQLGLFSSLVFLGTIIGSLISVSWINILNRKILLFISWTLCGLCLMSFAFTKDITLLFANRVFVGIFQAFISIYWPVWCDQFGVHSKRTMMIAFIQIAPPLGVVLGYLVTVLLMEKFGNTSWTYSFYIQACVIWIISTIIWFIPNKYFSKRIRKLEKYQETNAQDEESGLKTSNKKHKKERKESAFYEEKTEAMIDNDAKDRGVDAKKKSGNYIFDFKKKAFAIFSEPIFDFSVLTLASLFFVLTVIQYRASDYMEEYLKIDDEKQRLFSFAIVCLTSPTLGVILGGLIISSIGGYESRHSILVCLIFSLLSGLCTLPIPFVDKSLPFFTAYLWWVLFFGGAILSPLTGIIISSLPKTIAGSGNSFTIFFCNLLGFLPAPIVYGFLKESFGHRNAMWICIWSALSGVIFWAIATFFRYKNFDKIYSNQDNISIAEGSWLKEEDNNINNNNQSNLINEEKKKRNVSHRSIKVFNGMISVSYDDESENKHEDELGEGGINGGGTFDNEGDNNKNYISNDIKTDQTHEKQEKMEDNIDLNVEETLPTINARNVEDER